MTCRACQTEIDDCSADGEMHPRFEEEGGMAWVRGFAEGARLAVGELDLLREGPSRFSQRAGLCKEHAAYFDAVCKEADPFIDPPTDDEDE